MTTNTNVAQKAARRKLNLLELANGMENVSKACKIMGYARQLNLQGVTVSSGGVGGVWSRHKLSSRHQRLLQFEEYYGTYNHYI